MIDETRKYWNPFLETLAGEAEKMGIVPKTLGIKRMACAGEPLAYCPAIP
jgi:hypothetical protein